MPELDNSKENAMARELKIKFQCYLYNNLYNFIICFFALHFPHLS
jgi:hypothetical protein